MSEKIYNRIVTDAKVKDITPQNIHIVRNLLSDYSAVELSKELSMGRGAVRSAFHWLREIPPYKFQRILKRIYNSSKLLMPHELLKDIYKTHGVAMLPFLELMGAIKFERGWRVKGNKDIMEAYWPNIGDFPIEQKVEKPKRAAAGDRISQAIDVLKKGGPLTERRINELNFNDYHFAGIPQSERPARTSLKGIKERVLNLFKEGKIT